MAGTTIKKQSRALNIFLIIVIAILILAIVGVIFISVSFKGADSAPSIFGWNVYIMDGTEMEPEIPQGAAVFTKADSFPTGDVKGIAALVRLADGSKTSIMRIVNSETDENGLLTYWVRYDKAPDNTAQIIPASAVVGQAKSYSIGLGKFISFASSPLGTLLLIIIPCAVLIAYQIIIIILKAKNNEIAPMPDDIEIDEDEYPEFSQAEMDTTQNVYVPREQRDAPAGEHYAKPTAKDKKKKLEDDYEELAKGFGTHMFDSQHLAQKKAEKKTQSVNDFLFSGYKNKEAESDYPFAKTEPKSVTEKYGLSDNDEDITLVRQASKPVATRIDDTSADDGDNRKSVKVVKVKPRVTPKPAEVRDIQFEKPKSPSKPAIVTEIKIDRPLSKPQTARPSAPSHSSASAHAESKKTSNQKLEELMALLESQNKNKK